MIGDPFEIFYGDVTSVEARIYVRVFGIDLAETKLVGTIEGPESCYARTLPARIRLQDLGSCERAAGGELDRRESRLAEAILPDPCVWTPRLPYDYRINVELRRGREVVASVEQKLGIRPLGVSGHDLIFNQRRWVVRAVTYRHVRQRGLTACHAAAASVYVSTPSDQYLDEASRLGVFVVAQVETNHDATRELQRLSQWPAVGIAVLPTDVTGEFPSRCRPPNLLLGQHLLADRPANRASWADIALVELENVQQLNVALPGGDLPVLVYRSVGSLENVAAGRAACDVLQRDMAPYGDVAGYIV